jgi:hypothetical protein
MQFLGGKGGYISKVVLVFWNFEYDFLGLGEMFEGDFVGMCANFFLLVCMGGWAEGLVCANLEARTPIGASGNFISFQALYFTSSSSFPPILFLSFLYASSFSLQFSSTELGYGAGRAGF